MLKRLALVATFSTLGAFLFVPNAHAGSHWSIHIGVGAPVVVAPPPSAYIWRPGYYVAPGYGYRWVPGTWGPRRYYSRGPYYNRYRYGGYWGEHRYRGREWDNHREWRERGERYYRR